MDHDDPTWPGSTATRHLTDMVSMQMGQEHLGRVRDRQSQPVEIGQEPEPRSKKNESRSSLPTSTSNDADA